MYKQKQLKMKSFTFFSFVLLLTLCLISSSSCSSLTHITPTANAYLFSEKGDGSINLSAGIFGFREFLDKEDGYPDLNQLSLSLGQALSDHIIGAAQYSINKYGNFAGICLGYYTTFEEDRDKLNINRFETLLGLSVGKSSNLLGLQPPQRQELYFIQPAWAMGNEKYDLQFVFKLSLINISRPSSSYSPAESSRFWTFEPSLRFAYGWKHFKPFIQLQATKAFGNKEEIDKVLIIPTPVSLGLRTYF